ncbi:MAG: RNA 2',3'-cyclic phosphodiesterase [Desulfobulbaceae bacterium]|nr:RNA 2',3'-cyclic phosphodiesterase [Desulfobulbaceae bacterium]HIJ91025.1 RNA 2',3'-cyclic phosphodiesterase [Deltaproteobacteria bacterium]
MYRLFVAIDLPPDIVARLQELCYGVPGAKWVQPEQMHLTLRFIGEVDGGVFREIKEGLADIQSLTFSLQVKGLGFFPPRKTPRVLWAGIAPVEEVCGLRNRIENVLVGMGLTPEGRKYSPHITLARLHDTPLARLGRFLAGNGLFATEPFPVSEFHLYSSELTSKGAFHAIEASYYLR